MFSEFGFGHMPHLGLRFGPKASDSGQKHLLMTRYGGKPEVGDPRFERLLSHSIRGGCLGGGNHGFHLVGLFALEAAYAYRASDIIIRITRLNRGVRETGARIQYRVNLAVRSA